MTAGPLAGPASAYPTFRRPASICFSGPNDVWAPGLVLGRSAGFALPGCALAEPLNANCAAAMVMAAVPRKRRRWRSISSDILGLSIGESPGFDAGREMPHPPAVANFNSRWANLAQAGN